MQAWYPQKWFQFLPNLSLGSALVTLNLSRSQWLHDEKGVQAVRAEAQGLRQNQTWDDDSVDTLVNLRRWARQTQTPICVADLLTLCGIKHYELEPERWKYKGRIVYRGDRIRDSDGNVLLFEETATTPTMIIALQITLWFGMLQHHKTTCSDAVQAFLQSWLDENDHTYVIIPEELWLPSWYEKFETGQKVVVRLAKSLYGRPMAGRWWQDHLSSCLRMLGGIELEVYPSNFIFRWNPSHHGGTVDQEFVLILNVYVDDLTLSGHECCHTSFWSALSKEVKMEAPQEIDARSGLLILGRKHFASRSVQESVMSFDMTTYVDQVVNTYCELAGMSVSSLKYVSTPCLSESSLSDQDLEVVGNLSHVASRILMRALWLSRLSRPDLSFVIGRLTSAVTRWTRFEDKQLHRCISYLHHHRDLLLTGRVDHAAEDDLSLEVFTDSDFGACPHTSRSTTGILMTVRTGRHHFPLYWTSKKQSSTARSTPEAESIALATAVFGEVQSAQTVLQQLAQKSVHAFYRQDNEAIVTILQTGYSARLRHMPRVHRINVASVHEVLQWEDQHLVKTPTDQQRANGFTKAIVPKDWPQMLEQLCLEWCNAPLDS